MSFKVIIAGGRRFTDYKLLKETMNMLLKRRHDVTVISGACDTGLLTYNRSDGTIVCGADGLGEKYAREHGHPVTPFPAQWSTLGRSAGYIRNEEMAKYANAAVCFWDGQSRGTKHMIDLATQYGLKLRVVKY